MRKQMAVITLGLTLTLAVTGCIERKEKIRVGENGAVSYRLEYSGDPGDFESGDALPSERGGWRVEDHLESNEKGEKKQFRVAEMRVERGGEQPGDYAIDDEAAEVSLRFPTSLTIERRQDGVYYHFARRYEPRPYAHYDYYRKLLDKKDADGDSEHKNLEDMSESELTETLTRLRGIEALQRAEYVRAGAEALGDRWPVDTELHLRQALIHCFEQMDPAPLVALLRDPASDSRDMAIERESQRIISESREALEDEMQKLNIPRRERDEFFAAYDVEEHRRQVTEDISDERFQIEVEMPGEIIAHNGASVKGSTVTWEFGGEALLDRDERILVTSRVVKNTPAVEDNGR